MSNIFSCVGNVGRDAEVKALPSGQSVLNVTIGTSTGFGDKQKTMWIRCAIWGKRAEGQLVNYLKKGQQVFVCGELSQQEYQGTDGSTKTALELNAFTLDLVGKRSDNPLVAQSNNASSAQEPVDNFADFASEDIPF